MHVDLTEDAKAFHVKADLPGIKKDSIKVGALASLLAWMQQLCKCCPAAGLPPVQNRDGALLWNCCLCHKDATCNAAGCLLCQLLHLCLLCGKNLAVPALLLLDASVQAFMLRGAIACLHSCLSAATPALCFPSGAFPPHLQVNVDGHALTLSVQQQSMSDKEEEKGGVKWHCMERSSQFMQRVVPLPDSADVKAIQASIWQIGRELPCRRLAGTSYLVAGCCSSNPCTAGLLT